MKKSLIIIVCFITLAASPQETRLSLRQCIETGIANSLDVYQSGILVESGKINWNQAKFNLLPDLNGNIGAGINQGRNIDQATNSYINSRASVANYSLSSGVILFNGLSMQNSIKQNALSYEAAKMDWQQVKDNLTINIILAYLSVLSNEDRLTQVSNQVTLSTNQVERLEILNREGAIAPSLLSDLKGQFASDQLVIISTQNALETAKITLAQLMNVPYDKSFQLERIEAADFATRYEETPTKIYETALQQFALIKAADFRTRSAEKAVKVARGQMYPTLSLNGNVNTYYTSTFRNTFQLNTSRDVISNDYVLVGGVPTSVIYKIPDFSSERISHNSQLNNNLSSSISLNLQIPFFNSFFARNRVKLSKLTLKNNEIVAKTTKTRLQQDIEQAYSNMTAAFESYKVLLEQVVAYQESFRAAKIRFNAGVGTSVDYLVARTNLDRANLAMITAKYDYVLRIKILDYYQGKQLW